MTSSIKNRLYGYLVRQDSFSIDVAINYALSLQCDKEAAINALSSLLQDPRFGYSRQLYWVRSSKFVSDKN